MYQRVRPRAVNGHGARAVLLFDVLPVPCQPNGDSVSARDDLVARLEVVGRHIGRSERHQGLKRTL